MKNVKPGSWYQVVVGNIGTVYSGHSKSKAEKCFTEYIELSRLNYGSASAENVTLFIDNDIDQEYDGSAYQKLNIIYLIPLFI